MLERSAASRSTAKSSAARRSPRLLPSATAIRRRAALTALLDPAGRHHAAARAGAVGAAAEQVGAAGECLLEEALVLERLAEDHVEHRAVAGVGHGRDPRAPLGDEIGRGLAIVTDHAGLCVGPLAC